MKALIAALALLALGIEVTLQVVFHHKDTKNTKGSPRGYSS